MAENRLCPNFPKFLDQILTVNPKIYSFKNVLQISSRWRNICSRYESQTFQKSNFPKIAVKIYRIKFVKKNKNLCVINNFTHSRSICEYDHLIYGPSLLFVWYHVTKIQTIFTYFQSVFLHNI